MNDAAPSSSPPRERYRGDRLDLLKKIPGYARRLLVAGAETGLVAGIIKKALGAEVSVVETSPAHLPIAAAVASHAFDGSLLDELPDIGGAYFDFVIILDPTPLANGWEIFIRWVVAQTRKDRGSVLLLCDNPECDTTPKALDPQPLLDAAGQAGLGVYRRWEDDDEKALSTPRRFLYRLVHAGYDPFRLSQELHAEKNYDAAYNELAEVPEVYKEEPGIAVVLHSQLLFYLAEYAAAHDAIVAKAILFRAQEHLYEVIAKEPDFGPPHEYYAQIADLAGAHVEATKVRTSFRYAYPDKEGVAPPEPAEPLGPSPWSRHMASDFVWPSEPPRILYLIHPGPHYGLDLVFDGLCEALGDEKVLAWPYKATLHGEAPKTHAHYPCFFARRGEPHIYEAVRDQLSAGAFDVLFVGDCDCDLPVEYVRELVHIAQARGIPVCLLDAMDEYIDMRPVVFQRLGIERVDIYFKREMARFLDYGPHTRPMPFAYARSKIRPHDGPRDVPFFWAGHRNFGFRRQYLEFVETKLGSDLSIIFEPSEYARRIAATQIGFSLFGKGFDTVRYWELPAHGAMLLSDVIPMHIPHDFEDGVNAVLFSDLRDLDEKLDYYLRHPAEVARIARAGERHFLEHHTSEARARQVLHALHSTCFGGDT